MLTDKISDFNSFFNLWYGKNKKKAYFCFKETGLFQF